MNGRSALSCPPLSCAAFLCLSVGATLYWITTSTMSLGRADSRSLEIFEAGGAAQTTAEPRMPTVIREPSLRVIFERPPKLISRTLLQAAIQTGGRIVRHCKHGTAGTGEEEEPGTAWQPSAGGYATDCPRASKIEPRDGCYGSGAETCSCTMIHLAP